MGALERSIWISAAPSLVWELYTDIDRIAEWQTGDPRVLEVSGRGDEVGTTYIVRRGPGAARTTVTKAVCPAVHASRTEAYLGLSFDLTTNLSDEKGGTRLVIRAQTHWPSGLGLVGRLIEFAILNPREANRELERLKHLVEREATSQSS
jgi:uncharacterized protein YndB with AHSA1/START domain